MHEAQRVTIVGAGLAGSLMGILLRRRGFDVHIFERRPDSRITGAYGGRSINLALSHRGLRALARVGLDQRALDLAIPMRGRHLHDPEGKTSFHPYSPQENEYINSVSRSGLNELLLDAGEREGVQVRFGHTCKDIDFDQGVISFTGPGGGTLTHSSSVIIGADGASSNVRAAMERRELTASTIDQLPHGYKELTIPPNPDRTHRMEPEALHIWPRHSFMLIALPNLDGSFTCTLFLSLDGSPVFPTLIRGMRCRPFSHLIFPDAALHLRELQSDYDNNPTSFLQTVRCDRWNVEGKALLLGDAAHAIVPFYGQGMNCAFEDCVVLDDIIEQSGKEEESDWTSIFDRFHRERKPDADAIAELALAQFCRDARQGSRPSFPAAEATGNRIGLAVSRPLYADILARNLQRDSILEALRLSEIQQGVLDQILNGRKKLDDIDWGSVEDLLQSLSLQAETGAS